MKDNLGDRIKSYYEDRFRYKLPRRTYTIIRIDGKAFHTYTRGLERPFDKGLMEDMDETRTPYNPEDYQPIPFSVNKVLLYGYAAFAIVVGLIISFIL